ncbi:MAG: aminotransferase class V-fold PLP-dependent enzyme [Erythrobacter sp.]|nr:MAG: aminotransferase class V-fold PLP-dependent enzyme [Erythrobacter sp.]
MARIYLDHAATSPLRPEAKAAMEEGFALWANPSSPHAEGRRARAALEDARERCKTALGWDGELIFTSGASEALSIALQRAKVDRRIVSAVEHDAVFRAAPDAEVVPVAKVDFEYELDPDLLATALAKGGKPIVAMQAVNSETGSQFGSFIRIKLIETVHDAGGLVVSDCSQSLGNPPPHGVDLAVYSAHKLGGPVGVGALLVRDFAMLEPIGGHERGYRMGTENLPAALGFAAALEAGKAEPFDRGHHGAWQTSLEDQHAFKAQLWKAGEVLHYGDKSPHIIPVAHPTMSAQALLIRLDAMGFAVSAGSACSSGSLKPSRVLMAFGVDEDTARRTIRVSLGWNTTPEELDAFAETWRSLC